MEKKKFIIIDSNALLHRAFHALPDLTKKDGTPTNAVYGFVTTIHSVMKKFQPHYICATFDLKAPTFRHLKYKEYKAKRVKAPDEFYGQIPLAKKFLKSFNIPIFEKEGFEADDLIGTLTKNPEINGEIEKVIVTGDLDTLQLVDENTKVFTLRRGITDTVLYDKKAVEDRYGLSPDQMIDFKALRGDQSDNIPGVKGVGEKTATELLKKYQTLDGVYENLEEITAKALLEKLTKGKEMAYLSYELGKIKTDVPVEFDLEICKASDYDEKKLADFLKEMEFFSLIKRLIGRNEEFSGGKNKEKREGNNNEQKIEVVIDQKFSQIEKKLEKSERISFFGDRQVGFGVCADGSKGFFVSFSEGEEFLKKVFQNEKIEKIGFGLKEFLKEIFGESPKEIDNVRNYSDGQILAYLLKSGTKIEMEKLIMEEFGAEFANQTTKKGQASLLLDNDQTKKKELAEKAVWAFRLKEHFEKELQKISHQQAVLNGDKERTLRGVLEKMENPLVKILAKMEIAGVKVNEKILLETSDLAKKELLGLEKEIFEIAGGEFNVNSPQQLSEILFEKLKISTDEIRRGKTGLSTDADQLRKIRHLHPVVEKIEDHRELSKLKNTYTDALPKLIAGDGRIHASFNQASTATGRLSSSNPNLQNIPKKGRFAGRIRQAFVSEKGMVLVSADYSQIDLRCASHLSEDERMIDIFQKNKDIHRATAGWVNDIKEEEVSEKQRSEAKALNFGVLYGMGIYGFMRDSGVSRERAEFFIEQYMKKFSGLKRYLDETKKFALENGFVETELGRRRYIQNIASRNFHLRSMAERMAINLPIQGLSADIVKLAMVKVEEQILRDYAFDKARLILQIHDELVFEVKEGLAEEFGKKVKAVMEGVYALKVPLVVDVEMGENWNKFY